RVGVISSIIDSQGLLAFTRAVVYRAAVSFRGLGATLVDVELPHADYAVATYYLIAPSEASSNLARYDGAHYGYRAQLAGSEASLEAMYCRTRSEGFGAEVQRRIMLGMFALSSGYIDDYYGQALRVRRMIYEDYRKAFESVDMILGPVAPSTAFRLGEKLSDPVQMYLEDLFTVGANLAGVPAIAIPAGLSNATDGAPPMPLSIQLQGPPLSESRLLSAAHQLQQAGFFSPSLAPQF
ncbi:MAG: amidase family protein, partial [Aureliella sp.]